MGSPVKKEAFEQVHIGLSLTGSAGFSGAGVGSVSRGKP
jgi:hypothetical protein